MKNETRLLTQTIRISRSWERSTKTVSSRTGKMRRTGSASSNSCPPIIQRLGSLPPTQSGTSLVMQISRTRAPWHSSAILTPALTSFYSPFRLLRRKTSSRLYVEFLFADHTGATGRAGAGLNLTFGSPHSGSPRGGRRRSCGNHPWAMNVVCDSFNLVVDHIHTNC